MIRKKSFLALIVTLLGILVLSSQAFTAQEDTAKLTFTKTALAKKPLYTYTVQKGDVVSAIVRKMPGITEKEIPLYYRMIKELNPEIDDLNKLREGQELILPGKPLTAASEKAGSPSTGKGPQPPSTEGTQAYQVKKGDTLIHIVHRELHIPSKTQQMMLTIKSLNPSLKDANRIYVGQIIRLPAGQVVAQVAAGRAKSEKEAAKVTVKTDQPVKIVGETEEVLLLPEERKTQDQQSREGKDAIILPPAQRLAVVKHIVSQMNGSMMMGGNYYLPVSNTEQLTIDCSIIPVVELDGQTIFLDQGNRSDSQLKKIIHERWSNLHLVKIDDKDDIIIVLKKILQNTKNHEISKSQKPLSAGSHPPMEVVVDWVINKKDLKSSDHSPTQGIRFVYEPNSVLPRAIINYARKHSMVITEISPEKGLIGKPEEIYSLPPVKALPSAAARNLTLALLSYLHIDAEKDVDIKVFNITKDGFNLSIKADAVVERDGKKYIIFSRNLTPQFVNVLQKAGNVLIHISDQDNPSKTIETILRAFGFATTSGYFSFSGLDKNQPPYSFGFNGIKTKTDKDIYLVNFDFSEEIRGLMHESWSASIVRY